MLSSTRVRAAATQHSARVDLGSAARNLRAGLKLHAQKNFTPTHSLIATHHPRVAGMLDAESTVMAIWPAPMIYAGPTEVQFHAKSRRIGGASFFVVGRDPAGMPRSTPGPLKGEDLYNGDHGRYVLSYSPGVGSMEFISFQQVRAR